jgi:hypothetical protein
VNREVLSTDIPRLMRISRSSPGIDMLNRPAR